MDDSKTELVQRWLTKAAHDLDSARKMAADTDDFLDAAVYFCQQAAEKAIKAVLVFHNQKFRKIHDLRKLMLQAATYDKKISAWTDKIAFLTSYVSAFRYPFEEEEPSAPTRMEFERAFEAAQQFYRFVLSLLPEEVHP